MGSACLWGTWDEQRLCYPCKSHPDGSLKPGGRYCDKAPGFFAQLEQAESKLFEEQLLRVRETVESFPGWRFTGLKGRADRWTAEGPRNKAVTGGSPEELLAKVRAECGQGPKQQVLL